MNDAHCVLLTRHQIAAERTSKSLGERGYSSVVLPLSAIEPLDNKCPDAEFDGIILTSPVAASTLGNMQLDNRLLRMAVYCVGQTSAQHAKNAGFENIEIVENDAESLAQVLTASTNSGAYLYPCAEYVSFDFSSYLQRAGFSCEKWQIYSNRLLTPSKQEIAEAIATTNSVFLYSKRTARHFFEVVHSNSEEFDLSNHHFIAISQNVAGCIPRNLQTNTYIAEKKSEQSMMDCYEKNVVNSAN